LRVLVNGYIGKKLTGIGRALFETINSVSRMDRSLTFIVYTNFDNVEFVQQNFCENVIIKTYPISRMNSLKNLFFCTFIFPLLALRERADLVYIPNFTLILFKIRPIVTVIHDMIDFRVAEKFSKTRLFYRRFAVPQMARMSDHIITVSENSKKDLQDICGVDPSKITVVYNAVSNEFVATGTLSRIIEEDYMLYVGTVDYPGKNVHNAIKAFEIYKRQSKNELKFVICGMQGKGFDSIEDLMCNSDFKNDIIYFGYAEKNELLNLYTYAKLFIFISYYEGFGFPVLEAMKFGVPVITANKSSLPEVAGDAAVLCDPDNLPVLAGSIARINEDQSYANNLVAKGFENLKRFSWETAADKTIAVFGNCLK